MANGRGKLITRRHVYEGVFEKGKFVSGTESLKVKTFESNKNISSSQRADAENLYVKNKSRGKENTKKILVGTGKVTGKIFVGIMKFTGQVLLGVVADLPEAYAEQKRLDALARKAYLRGKSDGRRSCSSGQC